MVAILGFGRKGHGDEDGFEKSLGRFLVFDPQQLKEVGENDGRGKGYRD
jgi:hypothetical protein